MLNLFSGRRSSHQSRWRRSWLPLLQRYGLPLAFLAFGLYLLIAGLMFETMGDVADPFGPGGFAALIGGFVTALAVYLTVQALVAHRRALRPDSGGSVESQPDRPQDTPGEAQHDAAQDTQAETRQGNVHDTPWRAFAVVGATALYLLLLPLLGFVVSTVLALSGIATLTARRFKIGLGLVFPVVTTAALYAVFALLLGIRLP